MDIFYNAAELVVLATWIAAKAGRQEQKQRPDTLPPTAEDVGSHRIDQGDTGVEVFSYPVFQP
ncbi:MAG TPA: hypothetical protein VLY63_09180, partial [Anaerolineae bacterium]|nr:hypothetical protein [Anaerolineae bacterium]